MTGPREPSEGLKQRNVPKLVSASAVSADEAARHPATGETLRRITDFDLWSEWRRKQADRLFTWFYCLNGAVFLLVLIIWIGESWRPPTHPVITERVLMALIAASAAQLGALAWHVGRNLLSHGDPARTPHSRPP